jgi:hypothetical protein
MGAARLARVEKLPSRTLLRLRNPEAYCVVPIVAAVVQTFCDTSG